jgi:Leu/Phe-tRNA-protein transferase
LVSPLLSPFCALVYSSSFAWMIEHFLQLMSEIHTLLWQAAIKIHTLILPTDFKFVNLLMLSETVCFAFTIKKKLPTYYVAAAKVVVCNEEFRASTRRHKTWRRNSYAVENHNCGIKK